MNFLNWKLAAKSPCFPPGAMSIFLRLVRPCRDGSSSDSVHRCEQQQASKYKRANN